MNNSKNLSFTFAALVLAACGGSSNGNVTADAAVSIDAPVSSPVDATPPDAMVVPPVTVNVYDPSTGAPSSGLPVAFLNADNSVVAEVTTDTSGAAAAIMAAGGSVTVGAAQVGSDGNGNAGQVFTWLDVSPGDVLVANSPVAPTSADQFTINITTAVDSNANDYFVQFYCDDGEKFKIDVLASGTGSGTTKSTCTSAAIYLFAENRNGDELDFAYLNGVALSDGASIAFDTLTPIAIDTFSVSGISSGNNVNVPVTLTDSSNDLDRTLTRVSLSAGAGNGTFQLGSAANFDYMTAVSDSYGVGDVNAIFRSPATVGSFSGDMSALEKVASMQTLPSYDVQSSTFSWTEAGSVAADAASITFDVQSSDLTTRNFTWFVVGPDSSATLALPTLPTSLSSFAVLGNDTATVTSAQTVGVTGGYDIVRGTFFGTNHIAGKRAGQHIEDFSVLPATSQYVQQLFTIN